MSSLHSALIEFKEKLDIPHPIITRKIEKKHFSIIVYCLEDQIDVNK